MRNLSERLMKYSTVPVGGSATDGADGYTPTCGPAWVPFRRELPVIRVERSEFRSAVHPGGKVFR